MLPSTYTCLHHTININFVFEKKMLNEYCFSHFVSFQKSDFVSVFFRLICLEQMSVAKVLQIHSFFEFKKL